MSLSILYIVVSACMLLFQSCPALCNAMDCSPPGSSVHEILQARKLGQVAVSSPGDLPNPGIKPVSPAAPALQVNSLLLSHQGSSNI